MTTELERFSERFSPTGGVAAVGVRNQLGRPNMDVLLLLAREAVQNMWDARRETESVDCRFAGAVLNDEQASHLRDMLLHNPPPALPLADRLADDVRTLLVSDRGTSGLGGPLRADVIDADHHDFADFIRNVGQPPDKRFGGGTYGYGKGALYLSSRVSVIVVHSRCIHNGEPESRFIIAGLGEGFIARDHDGQDRPHTGRHWWGRIDPTDGVVDPLLNREAAAAADALGMPQFGDEELGTDILILDPVFGDREPSSAMTLIANALAWNFWPKMIRRDGRPEMRFVVSWDGASIPVPDPEVVQPLRGFVEALRAVESPTAAEVEDITWTVARRRVGRVALRRFVQLQPTADAPGASFAGRSHHVALLRAPRLVVRYVEGPAFPDEFVEYAGVFLADEEFDRTYARSEPPTHDDWVAIALDDPTDASIVRTTIRKIHETMERFSQPHIATQGDGSDIPLGALAARLGALLPGEAGAGSRVLGVRTPRPSGEQSSQRNGRSGEAGRPSRPLVEPRTGRANLAVGEPRPTSEMGVRALRIPFQVIPAPASDSSRVWLRTGAAIIDGGQLESDPPSGSPTPELLAWVNGQGERLPASGEVHVAATDSANWHAIVMCPRDVAIGIELDVEAL